ncbi:transposase [Streptomyces sp. NBC_01210]|uniref:transposase n=1 Tax=Streptomyces sp. NBC_01210 TaxID=2903774 RepID=UPI002E143745
MSCFRGEFYAWLGARRDELFELTDAVLCADGPVRSPVNLTLLPDHRRGHGALHGGVTAARSSSASSAMRWRASAAAAPGRAAGPSRRPGPSPP